MSQQSEHLDFSGLFKLDVLVHLDIVNHTFYEVGLKKFIALSSDKELMFLYINPQWERFDNVFDWDFVDNPVYCMCFDPSGTWVLIVSDQKVLLVPFLPLFIPQNTFDHKWSLSSVTVLPLGDIVQPTSVVWWITKESENIIIIGSKTGTITFYSLESQKIIAETKVNGQINDLQMCFDDSLDLLALLISKGPIQQWKLVLEHRSFGHNWITQIRAQNDKDKKEGFMSYIRQLSKDKITLFIQGGSKGSNNWALTAQYVLGRHYLTAFELNEGTIILESPGEDSASRTLRPKIKKDGQYIQGLWSQRLLYLVRKNELEVHSANFSVIQSQPDGWIARLGVFGRIHELSMFKQDVNSGNFGNAAVTAKLLALLLKIRTNMAAAIGLWELVPVFSIHRGYPHLFLTALKARKDICRGAIMCLLNQPCVLPILLEENGQWLFDFITEKCNQFDTIILKAEALFMAESTSKSITACSAGFKTGYNIYLCEATNRDEGTIGDVEVSFSAAAGFVLRLEPLGSGGGRERENNDCRYSSQYRADWERGRCGVWETPHIALWASGAGVFGQLGGAGRDKSSRAVRVALPDPVQAIAAGYFHNVRATHARRTTPTFTSDQVAPTASATSSDSHLVPQLVDIHNVKGKIVQVSAGWHHSCIIDSTGTVYTWGLNFDGQLGSGDRKQVQIPTEVQISEGPSDVKENTSDCDDGYGGVVACGGDFTLNNEVEKSINRMIMMKTTKRVIKIPASRSNNKFIFQQVDRIHIMFPFDIDGLERKSIEPIKNPLAKMSDFKRNSWADELIILLKPWINEDMLLGNSNMAAKFAYHNNNFSDCLKYLLDNLKREYAIDRIYLTHPDDIENASILTKQDETKIIIRNAISKRIKDISMKILNEEPYAAIEPSVYKSLPCCCDELKYSTKLTSKLTHNTDKNLSLQAAHLIDKAMGLFPVDAKLWETCFKICKDFYLENDLCIEDLEVVMCKFMENNASTMASAIMYSKDCAQYAEILTPKFYLNMCNEILDTWG
ncbi:unnamed protein product [Leptidea sinapis]|uniref:Uncharacterized protein n=1 Tax=Leptidea sinapis TaxID=189913 RepID=A0A5E4QG30_9NEOP|nr:unnamed protein product [Leptidea sinapis]